MKCPNCDKTLSDKTIKAAKRRQKSLSKQSNAKNYNIYCDMKCFYEFKGMKKRGSKKARICPECGGKKGKESMRCGDCRSIAVSEYRLDSDVKELVVLNSGAGFDYFIDMVFGRGGTANNKRERRSRLLMFLQDLSEIEGVDYVAWLENPAAMRDIAQEDCPPEMERYIRFQRRTTVSNHEYNKRVRKGLPTVGKTHRVKIPPEFNWGRHKPL
tara:strand:+ start:43 stop:681 length:639 start_codon:yes stop_codon:yes gene_type:complete